MEPRQAAGGSALVTVQLAGGARAPQSSLPAGPPRSVKTRVSWPEPTCPRPSIQRARGPSRGGLTNTKRPPPGPHCRHTPPPWAPGRARPSRTEEGQSHHAQGGKASTARSRQCPPSSCSSQGPNGSPGELKQGPLVLHGLVSGPRSACPGSDHGRMPDLRGSVGGGRSRREVQGRGILKRRRPQQGAGADPGPARRPQPWFPGVCLRIQGHTLGPSEQAAPWPSRLSLRPQGTGGFRLMARSSGGKDRASPWAQASRDGGAAGAEEMVVLGGGSSWAPPQSPEVAERSSQGWVDQLNLHLNTFSRLS